MATEKELKENASAMTFQDLQEFSNIFACEFNSSYMHDRVLCFQILNEKEQSCGRAASKTGRTYCLEETEFGQPEDLNEEKPKAADSQEETVKSYGLRTRSRGLLKRKWRCFDDGDELEGSENEKKRKKEDETTTGLEADTVKASNFKVQEDQGETPGGKHAGTLECQSREAEVVMPKVESCKSTEMSVTEDALKVSKLFVHSQWLAVQSSYFKSLFYSGMKESFSKEVVMKIHRHELEAHLTLIEAMYKLDVLATKDYRLVVNVLILAHKYDVSHVIKKCKYVLCRAATLDLEMCECILGKIEQIPDSKDILEMIENFLVKEFAPIDRTWTLPKFSALSEAALKLLLGSDKLATQSENTIFTALMEWVSTYSFMELSNCCLLSLVRFEYLSVDFLYDIVQQHYLAQNMHGFKKIFLDGLAYHAFSPSRRALLASTPTRRPSYVDDNPTFTWVIDNELQEILANCPAVAVFSDIFWYQGYAMKLKMRYVKDSNKYSCSVYVCNLMNQGACLHLSYTIKSSLFLMNIIRVSRKLITAARPFSSSKKLDGIPDRKGKSHSIDIWVTRITH